MKITDVTVKRYSAAREPRRDPGGIQIVEVHTDVGVTGRGFVSAGSASSDIVATLIRRNLKERGRGRESPAHRRPLACRCRRGICRWSTSTWPPGSPTSSGSSTSWPTTRLLEFQSRLFRGPILREERTDDGIFLIPPDGPGLGLELDEAVAAAALVPE